MCDRSGEKRKKFKGQERSLVEVSSVTVKAYLMCKVNSGDERDICKKLTEFANVIESCIVCGEYDVIVKLQARPWTPNESSPFVFPRLGMQLLHKLFYHSRHYLPLTSQYADRTSFKLAARRDFPQPDLSEASY